MTPPKSRKKQKVGYCQTRSKKYEVVKIAVQNEPVGIGGRPHCPTSICLRSEIHIASGSACVGFTMLECLVMNYLDKLDGIVGLSSVKKEGTRLAYTWLLIVEEMGNGEVT
jgi:hypothetical protein